MILMICPEQRQSYKKALNDIDKIRDYLNPFLHKSSITEFRKNLDELINKLELPVRIIAGSDTDAEKNIKSINAFLETTDEILSLLNNQFGEKEKFPIGFFLHNLKTAVSSSRYNIAEKPGYGVQITTLNEIRGLKFDHLFIAGLCDGDFPTRFSPEIFFSGTMARIRGEQNHLTVQRYLFYQSLCAWNKKLYLTFPRRDERKEFVQSDFLQEFLNTFEVSVGEDKDYENTIYTRQQLLAFIGKNGIEKTKELFDLNSIGLNTEEITTAMKIDLARTENPFMQNAFTGFISEDLSSEGKINLTRMKDRQFSITQLETYALCPYKYFAERILKLDVFEEPTEEIEALELGSLIHSILFNFYSKLKKDKIVLNACSDADFRKAENLLFKIAEERVKEVNFNSPLSFFEREKIFGIDGNRKNSMLYKFLIEEKESTEGYIPEFFETGFGQVKEEENQKVRLKELKAGEVKVRGKIDRVDINRDTGTYKIYDYKTGKSKLSKNDIYDGLQLQLMLYLYAAKEIIKSELNEEYKPAGASIYSLKYSAADFGRKELSFGKKNSEKEITEKYVEMIEICLEAINRYVDGISRGDFRLSQLEKREEKVCRYCSFRSICRIQEVN